MALPSLRDEQHLRSVYDAHSKELYGIALRSLADEVTAEEAVEETFLRAWQAADRFDPELGSMRTWLFAILRNVIVDLLRRTNRAPYPSTDETGTYDPIEKALLAWQVEEALRRMSDDHRVVLVETYYKGRPYSEVASDLGTPVGTVKSRVYYALRSLRLVLEEMGWTDEP